MAHEINPEMHTAGILKGRDHFGDLDTLKMYCVKVWSGLNWLRVWKSSGLL
jgi:hypothetical protein